MPREYAQKRLTQAFNAAFRKGLFAFAASYALAAAGPAAARDAPAPDAAAIETQIQLQDSARSKFTELVTASDSTGYGARLTRLEGQLNAYLRLHGDDNQRHNMAVVLNPALTDVGLSLGMDLHDVVAGAVRGRGGVIGDSRIADIVERLKESHVTAGGTVTYTQAPAAALHIPDGTREACVIIPSPQQDKPYAIPGLSERQMEDYLNMHEGWHCLDGRYASTAAERAALEKTRTLDDLRGDTAAQRAASSVNLQEALADTGALGDMIRSGASPALIERVISWRESAAELDLEHNTVPVLRALQAHIRQTGLENFRKIDDQTARALYFRLTDSHGLTQPRLQNALDDLHAGQSADGSDTLRQYYHARFIRINGSLNGHGMSPVPAGAVEKAEWLRTRLSGWDARETLETAAAQSGHITPESLVRAYGRLKQGLQRDVDAGHDAEINREKISRLRVELAVIGSKEIYDFAAANRRHGAALPDAPAAAAPAAEPAAPPRPQLR